MESKADYIQGLRNQLSEVGSEIGNLIASNDRLAVKIKQGFDEIETALLARQSATEAKLAESSMSGDEVWDLVWDNVWDAVKEFNSKVTTEIKQDYRELEPTLKAKQSELQIQLHESTMSGDAIWNEVWGEVWNVVQVVVEKLNRQAAAEIKQIGEVLEALEVKQSDLQAKLHELLISGDEVWNVVKEVTQGMEK